MFSRTRGQQRPVVKVERIDTADLDAWDVVVARVAVSAARTMAVASTAERRLRVDGLAWP